MRKELKNAMDKNGIKIPYPQIEVHNENNYGLNSIVQMKKMHPCGCDTFKVIRVGVDIKIECTNCGRTIMLPRVEFNKKIKKVLTEAIE